MALFLRPRKLTEVIAISSYRPMADSLAIGLNQIAAKLTWDKVFQEVIYFGEPEEALNTRKTSFIQYEGKPRIKDMAELASKGFGWKAIINADIQVAERAKHLDRVLNMYGAECGFSFRIPVGKTEKVDHGIDFFCAKPDVWRQVAMMIPEQFTIARQQWDTWVCSFFMRHWPTQSFDISPCKLFFHPEHGERGDQSLVIRDPYLKNMRWSARPLRF